MKNFISFTLIIILSISASYRGYDGGDTADYFKYFQIIAETDGLFNAFENIQDYKFGYTFFLITFLVSRFFEFQIYLIIIGLISNTLLLSLYKKLTKKFYLMIFIMSVSTITHYYYSYNAIRQPISNLIILLVIFNLFNYNSLLKSLISFDLHPSSFIYPPIYFLINHYKYLKLNFKYLLISYLFAVIVISFFLDKLLNIDNYNIFIKDANLFTLSFFSPIIIYFVINKLNVNDINNNLFKFYIIIWLTRLIFYKYNELFLRLSYCQHILEPIFIFYIIKNSSIKITKKYYNKFLLYLITIILSATYFLLIVFPLYD